MTLNCSPNQARVHYNLVIGYFFIVGYNKFGYVTSIEEYQTKMPGTS